MKIEYKMFIGLAIFFFLTATLYGLWAGPEEPVGTVALGLTGGLALVVGSFLWFSGRRLEAERPEDNVSAEISDGAGELGFFSPGSYWPICIAASTAVFALATAFLLVWLMILMVGFLLLSICGLLFEYQRSYAH